MEVQSDSPIVRVIVNVTTDNGDVGMCLLARTLSGVREAIAVELTPVPYRGQAIKVELFSSKYLVIGDGPCATFCYPSNGIAEATFRARVTVTQSDEPAKVDRKRKVTESKKRPRIDDVASKKKKKKPVATDVQTDDTVDPATMADRKRAAEEDLAESRPAKRQRTAEADSAEKGTSVGDGAEHDSEHESVAKENAEENAEEKSVAGQEAEQEQESL